VRGLIRGGWVVGFAGQGHTLIRDGVVVWENDRIVHVGVSFSGTVDEEIDARGKLVCHCLIDTDVHSGHGA
jgi:cytosine/adenosine deaminase-related metal-dependent hydrolase